MPSSDGIHSARFEYFLDTTESLSLGLESFRNALPYLYGTRPTFGKVTSHVQDGEPEEWTPGPVGSEAVAGGIVYHRDIQVVTTRVVEMRILRFMTHPDAHVAALVLLMKHSSGWGVVIPDAERPRIYREYPLRGSGFLSINVILDGKFDPDQERSRLLMSEGDKGLVEEGLTAALLGVSKCMKEQWQHAHLLARASVPDSAFDPTDTQERKWWTSQLSFFATQLASLPIIDTAEGMLPAVSTEATAHFVLPRLSAASPADETTVERMWPLVVSAGLLPPRLELATDWTRTSHGWGALGVSLNLITLDLLAEVVRPSEPILAALEVEGDKRQWLASFIDVVGECWEKREGHSESILDGLLPDQAGRLTSPDKLKQDVGVTEELKDICGAMGFDVRSLLLDSELPLCAKTLNLKYLVSTLADAVSETASENDIIEKCLDHLDDNLPEGSKYKANDEVYLRGSIQFLDHLLRSQGRAAEGIVKKVPFVTADTAIVRWSRDRMLMAPVRNWHQSAQRFWTAYPPDRVLIDAYAEGNLLDVIAGLAIWGVLYLDPIAESTPTELKDRRLTAIAEDKSQADGVTVSGYQFSQIALLQPELINRCRAGVEEARALLGLVLCHVAPNDPRWREPHTVPGKRAGKEVPLNIRGALWLADLSFQAWVPVQDPDGKLNQMTASVTTLQGLLDPSWLEHNDAGIALLSEWFGFDELELRLLGMAPDAEKRQQLRNGLAQLVESAGSDPRIYEALAQEIEARRDRERDIARCRQFGLAIQEAIRGAMEARHLKLTLVDRGYDFEVLPPTEDVLTGAAGRIEVGPYLLEVKASTTGQARMTPTQAATARAEAVR